MYDFCADGKHCCDNDPQCCEKGRGVFLDESGKVGLGVGIPLAILATAGAVYIWVKKRRATGTSPVVAVTDGELGTNVLSELRIHIVSKGGGRQIL